MGTFIGHLVPGLAFTFLGLWHTLNSTKTCNKTQTLAWFPFPKIKHLELYLILSFSLLAVVVSSQSHGLLDLQHATMSLHLSLYAAAALFSKPTSPLVPVLAASAFGQELFLLHFHSADHTRLERQYHWLLQLVVAVCFLTTALSAVGTGFVVVVVRSAAVTCQGVWFVVMGFVLWVPRFAPEECYSGVECGSEEAEARAVGVANLRFSWVVAGVLVVVVVVVRVVEEWEGVEYKKLKCGCMEEGELGFKNSEMEV